MFFKTLREQDHCGEAALANALASFGDQKGVARPVPIPNTAVKRPIADGSGCIASARVGRRQINKAELIHFNSAFSFCLSVRQRSPLCRRCLVARGDALQHRHATERKLSPRHAAQAIEGVGCGCGEAIGELKEVPADVCGRTEDGPGRGG